MGTNPNPCSVGPKCAWDVERRFRSIPPQGLCLRETPGTRTDSNPLLNAITKTSPQSEKLQVSFYLYISGLRVRRMPARLVMYFLRPSSRLSPNSFEDDKSGTKIPHPLILQIDGETSAMADGYG